jgi:hypothetical protein
MPRLVITDVPVNRRELMWEIDEPVRNFRAATAILAKDLRKNATHEFRNMVMREWAKSGKSGGFAVRNGKHSDSWVMFEYKEGE